MFSRNLYDHIYDIDDVLTALCGDDHPGRWLLSTRNGQLIKELTPTSTKDGDDENHWHIIQPLPLSILKEFTRHPNLSRQSPELQKEINQAIAAATSLSQLPPLFGQSHAGAWLRERLKEVALEWLDARNLIPPSMRHVKDASQLFRAPAGKIQIIEN